MPERILNLSAGQTTLQLLFNEDGLCECLLVREHDSIRLGAESTFYIFNHLRAGISSKVQPPTGDIEGQPVEWVLSLNERHMSLYRALRPDGILFFWQDGYANVIGKMFLSADEKQVWLEKLQPAALL